MGVWIVSQVQPLARCQPQRRSLALQPLRQHNSRIQNRISLQPASSLCLRSRSCGPPTAIQAGPTVSPVVAPSITSAPASIAEPAVSAAPAPEPTASVHYAQGQLTVTSQSASLGTVLKLISAKTGAVIDLAPELQNEPVVAQIGPSGVREVMTALLDSPRIDYIIMGSGAAPGGLERILVRTRQSFGRTEIAANRPFQPPPPPAETELKLNENVPPVAGVAKPQTPLTQEQLMANWQKVAGRKTTGRNRAATEGPGE